MSVEDYLLDTLQLVEQFWEIQITVSELFLVM